MGQSNKGFAGFLKGMMDYNSTMCRLMPKAHLDKNVIRVLILLYFSGLIQSLWVWRVCTGKRGAAQSIKGCTRQALPVLHIVQYLCPLQRGCTFPADGQRWRAASWGRNRKFKFHHIPWHDVINPNGSPKGKFWGKTVVGYSDGLTWVLSKAQ